MATILFASLSTIWQLAELIVTGLIVVFLALWFLALACVVMAQLVKLTARRQLPAKSVAPVAEELSEEMLVVIAAAVEAVLAKPAKILSVQPRGPDDRSWSLQGRIHHHDSHAVRQRSPR